MILAEMLDCLLSGELPQLGDLLMQRFKSLQVSHTHGWKVANHVQVTPAQGVTLVSNRELRSAQASRKREQAVEAKAK